MSYQTPGTCISQGFSPYYSSKSLEIVFSLSWCLIPHHQHAIIFIDTFAGWDASWAGVLLLLCLLPPSGQGRAGVPKMSVQFRHRSPCSVCKARCSLKKISARPALKLVENVRHVASFREMTGLCMQSSNKQIKSLQVCN